MPDASATVPARNRIPWGRLWALARPEAASLGIGTLALLIASGMSLAYPQAVKWMVDAVIERHDFQALNYGASFLLVTFVVQAVFVAIRSWLFTVSGERVVARLRIDLFRAILGQDVAFFDASRTGELTNRLASDTTVLQNAVTVNVSMILRYLLGAVGGLALLLYTSPLLTVVSMAVVPFVAIGASVYGRMIRRQSQDYQDALATSTVVAEEALSSLRTVRAFAREPFEADRYAKAVDVSFQVAARRALALGAFSGVGGLAGYLALALVVWYGCRLVLADSMTLGDLTAFLLYTGLVAMSLGMLAGLYGDFMKAIGASERVFELLDRAAPLEDGGGVALADVKGAIAFERLSFAYPSRSDVEVLRDFDLAVQPGEVVALVGPSGSGKSTVASLLLRFYDPTSGSVRVDGQDLRGISPTSLRERVGIVSQEPVLFATSIAENIRYGRPGASEADVIAAARAANAEEFVTAFPDGFATLVGERGVQLSGGQKQRIAIARALLKDPPILVLDEATSALDAESEHLVQDALDRLMKGRTTLVIAHRLSTVQGADRVVVLDHGKVVEQGSHADLVARDGLYRRLVQRQFAAGRETPVAVSP
jgi:ABC transporter fused permease/ATP-binding protein